MSRRPLASEYLARGSREVLDQFLSERGGSIGLSGTPEGAAALQAQAAGLGRALGLNDALIRALGDAGGILNRHLRV